MNLQIKEEGKGEIEIHQFVPKHLMNFVVPNTTPLYFKGVNFNSLCQEFKGKGFSAWYNRFWIKSPVVVEAWADMKMLELRIALKNVIHGTWDKISNPVLPVHCFQMGFVPFVKTRAIFQALEYETFDIHFDAVFLHEFGIDYKTLARFLKLVDDNEPAELSRFSYPCSNLMMESVNVILKNDFTPAGKARLLKCCITNILTAALEIIGKDEIGKLPLSDDDIEALHHVRQMIKQYCPVYPGNDELVRMARPALNSFKLSYGFRRLFQMTPYDYFLEQRLLMAKDLLRQGHKVVSIANELEYESSTAFIKTFRKKFKLTPKQYQLRGD